MLSREHTKKVERKKSKGERTHIYCPNPLRATSHTYYSTSTHLPTFTFFNRASEVHAFYLINPFLPLGPIARAPPSPSRTPGCVHIHRCLERPVVSPLARPREPPNSGTRGRGVDIPPRAAGGRWVRLIMTPQSVPRADGGCVMRKEQDSEGSQCGAGVAGE